jgi:hypothetical protein
MAYTDFEFAGQITAVQGHRFRRMTVGISITPAGMLDGFSRPDTYHAPQATLTVAADERSGTVNGD